MISKGRSRADGDKLATYLLKTNSHQKVTVMDIRGAVNDDLREALTDWELAAQCLTKGEKPLYHTQIRTAAGEHLTADQWLETVDKLEKRLHLEKNPRAVVAHNLDGQVHLHAVWSRLDIDHEKLVPMSYDRKSHHRTSRELEVEFGLRQLNQGPTRRRAGSQRQHDVEHNQAKEAGTTREFVQKVVTAAWEASDTGEAFRKQLQVLGITLARGDRRDFVIEHEGKLYNPVRLIEGIRTKDFRERMEGLEAEKRQKTGPVVRADPPSPTRRRAHTLTGGDLNSQLIQNKEREPQERQQPSGRDDLSLER